MAKGHRGGKRGKQEARMTALANLMKGHKGRGKKRGHGKRSHERE